MATVSTLPNGSSLGRQHIAPKEPAPWDLDRPSSQENPASSLSKPYPSGGQQSLHRKANAMPLSTQPANGNTRPPSDSVQIELEQRNRTNGSPKPSQTPPIFDASYLSPHKPSKFRPLSDKSRSGSEADSLIDLYGHPRSIAEGTDKGDHDTRLEDLYGDQNGLENSWIHRDKLAVIESQEMQEAGIKIPRQRRSQNNLKSKRSHSRNHSTASAKDSDEDVTVSKENRPPKQRSPVRREAHDDPVDYDLRTPGEIASDLALGNSAMYYQPSLRQSSSRIPLPTASHVPIPQGHIERHTPLPRKRGASGNWSGGDEDGIAYNKSRSNSVSSRILIDDSSPYQGSPTPGALSGSPEGPTTSFTKSRVVYKPGSVTNARPRTSNGVRNVSEPQRSRSTSNNNRISPSTQRPKSRSGLEARSPAAINRPEGEAPWLATMYKPDPRLPPDQQILPTHAKRLQQEQMERERKASGGGSQMPIASHMGNGLGSPSSPAMESDPDSPISSQPQRQKFSDSLGRQWVQCSQPQRSPMAPVSGETEITYQEQSIGRDDERRERQPNRERFTSRGVQHNTKTPELTSHRRTGGESKADGTGATKGTA
ncbi:MAG: hypothetical protein Q9190_004183 [Brigantiaea leucoxantha]